MANNVKELQQLAEASGGVSTLDWSTISHTHGGGPTSVNAQYASAEFKDVVNLVKQLQQLPNPAGVAPLEWSTISHTHGGPK